jgi:nucleoside-diphosphate-sugar epimerase
MTKENMRIFLTGATGYIGGAVALALRERGHDVAALVRPESESKHLRDAGVVIVAGDLASLPSLGETLAAYDVFVHAAQSNTDTAELARASVEAFAAQKGFLIYTSGVWVLGSTRDAGESSPVQPFPLVSWRPGIEQQALAAGGAVLRPGCVYGGKQSLLGPWFAAAEQKQPLKIAGDGENHWALVDLHDLADCYVRLVEQRLPGIFHAVDDTRATMNECARAVAPDAILDHVPAEGAFGEVLAADQIISSDQTRRTLGWIPKRDFLGSIDEQWREWRSALQKAE